MVYEITDGKIDTRKEYRLKGLAYACGAKLILECLKRDLYPSWDAQNLWSASLAEKLGTITATATKQLKYTGIDFFNTTICFPFHISHRFHHILLQSAA